MNVILLTSEGHEALDVEDMREARRVAVRATDEPHFILITEGQRHFFKNLGVEGMEVVNT